MKRGVRRGSEGKKAAAGRKQAKPPAYDPVLRMCEYVEGRAEVAALAIPGMDRMLDAARRAKAVARDDSLDPTAQDLEILLAIMDGLEGLRTANESLIALRPSGSDPAADRRRRSPLLDAAKRALKAEYPDGIPDNVPTKALRHILAVRGVNASLPTTERAAGRRR